MTRARAVSAGGQEVCVDGTRRVAVAGAGVVSVTAVGDVPPFVGGMAPEPQAASKKMRQLLASAGRRQGWRDEFMRVSPYVADNLMHEAGEHSRKISHLAGSLPDRRHHNQRFFRSLFTEQM